MGIPLRSCLLVPDQVTLTTVMASLDCQLGWIWTWAVFEVFLDHIILNGKTHLEGGWHILVKSQIKGYGGRRTLLLPTYIHSCWHILWSCCCYGWFIGFLGFKHRLRIRNSLGILQSFSATLALQRIQTHGLRNYWFLSFYSMMQMVLDNSDHIV